jgi:hypothetical protein
MFEYRGTSTEVQKKGDCGKAWILFSDFIVVNAVDLGLQLLRVGELPRFLLQYLLHNT